MYSFSWALEMYRRYLVLRGRAPGVNVQNVSKFVSHWVHYLRNNDKGGLDALKIEMRRAFNDENSPPRTLKDELLLKCIANKTDFQALFSLSEPDRWLTALQNDLFLN
jgi:hypothetical protein